MSKATRRSLQFADLDEVVAEAQRLQESGYTRLGNWSLGQCCNHLAQAVNLSVDRYSFRFPWPISTINRALFFNIGWVPALLGKLSVPTLPGFSQKDPVDDTEGMNRLIDAFAGLEAASEADLEPHPLFGRLTKHQWQRFHAFHAQRHLSFLVPNDQSLGQNQQADQTESKSAAVHT